MLLESEADLIVVLGVLAALLLAAAIGAGLIALIRTAQVRQFQELLFKAERKIDHLERRMFNVLNAVPVALVETDATGKFIFANKAAHQLLGRKDNELIGLRFHSATWGITYPDGRVVPPDLLPIARTLRGQTVKGFQHLISNHGSQTKVLVSVTSMPIMNTNGEVIGSTTALVEIETQTGEGVGDISGVWRGQWFSAAPVPFWGLDQNGTVLDLNARVGSVFDTPRDQAVGQNWARVFVAEADYRKAVDFLADLPQEGPTANHPASINLSLKDVRGTLRPVILTAWIVRTQDGTAQGITVEAIPTDITLAVSQPLAQPLPAPEPTLNPTLGEDMQQAFDDLQKAELARAALGVGVWSYDPASDSIVEDEGMRRLIGRDVDGGPTRITPEDQLRANDAFGQLMSGDSDTLDLELSIPQEDGATRYVLLKGQATMVEGQRELFGVALDVTDAKSATVAPLLLHTPPAETVEDDTRLTELEAELSALKASQDEVLAERDALKTRLETAEAENETYTADLEALDASKVAQAEALSAAEADRDALRAEIEALKAENPGENPELEALRAEIEALKAAEPVAVLPVELAPQRPEEDDERAALEATLEDARNELEALKARNAELDAQTSAQDAELESLRQAHASLSETLTENTENRTAAETAREEELTALRAEVADLQALKGLEDELSALKGEKAGLEAEYAALLAAPQPEPKPERQLSDIAPEVSPLNRVWKTDGTLVRLSPAWHSLTGCAAQDFLADGWLDCLHPDDQDRVQAELSALMEARSGGELSYRVKTPAGFAPVLERVTPVVTDNAFDGLVGVAFDLSAHLPPPAPENPVDRVELLTLKARTGQLELEIAQLQLAKLELEHQAEKLDAALDAAQRFETVGRLTGDVAADFSQMLNVMNAALDMIGKQADNTDLRRLSEAALAAGKRGERLTRQLLAFTAEAKEKA
ncbi:MAG: PAS domain-containing protein [Asticcacaulis sp.]